MKRRFFALLFSFAFLAVAASAHGNKKHVIGTIQKVDASSVTVKTSDGKSVEVKLVASTAYVKRVDTVDKPATLSDLAVGENVVVHATPKGETWKPTKSDSRRRPPRGLPHQNHSPRFWHSRFRAVYS